MTSPAAMATSSFNISIMPANMPANHFRKSELFRRDQGNSLAHTFTPTQELGCQRTGKVL
jgi:hypothetical protein